MELATANLRGACKEVRDKVAGYGGGQGIEEHWEVRVGVWRGLGMS